jgi:hypothetical protein
MSRFRPYSPDQAYLLPPNAKDVLGKDHLVFFVHEVLERLELRDFENAYSEEAAGGPAFAFELLSPSRVGALSFRRCCKRDGNSEYAHQTHDPLSTPRLLGKGRPFIMLRPAIDQFPTSAKEARCGRTVCGYTFKRRSKNER